MNWRAIFAIVRKDLQVVGQNRSVRYSLIFVPLLLLVIMPAAMVFIFSSEAATADLIEDASLFLNNIPPGIAAELEQFERLSQQIIYMAAVYLFAPLFLIVPLIVSSVIGSDAFAGEKERKTLEALLYAPVTDVELYTAKLLSAWIPAMIVCIIGAGLYILSATAAAFPVIGGFFFPNLMWVILVLWLAPGVAGLGLGAIVMVSSRAKTTQESYQLGGMVVLPIVLLMISQINGLLYLSTSFVLLAGLVIWVINAVLIYLGAKTMRRSELIARL